MTNIPPASANGPIARYIEKLLAEKEASRREGMGPLRPIVTVTRQSDETLVDGGDGVGGASLPSPTWWNDRMYFTGARDEHLDRLTNGRFRGRSPEEQKASGMDAHPIFVLAAFDGVAAVTCPCTSQRKARYSYIRRGTAIGRCFSFDKNSYLLTFFAFKVTAHMRYFCDRLLYRGCVPEDAICHPPML